VTLPRRASWSAKAISKAINATCLYRHIDANIEATVDEGGRVLPLCHHLTLS
jgi:hypothetical protein